MPPAEPLLNPCRRKGSPATARPRDEVLPAGIATRPLRWPTPEPRSPDLHAVLPRSRKRVGLAVGQAKIRPAPPGCVYSDGPRPLRRFRAEPSPPQGDPAPPWP